MSDRTFDLAKMVFGFALAAIVGPLVTKTFTYFDSESRRVAASRERALQLHDRLIQTGAARIFWARRILREVEDRQSLDGASALIDEYDRALAEWNGTTSASIRTIEKTYPVEIWCEITNINNGMTELTETVRRQVNDLKKEGNAGSQSNHLAHAQGLADAIVDLSYRMQAFIESPEFGRPTADHKPPRPE